MPEQQTEERPSPPLPPQAAPAPGRPKRGAAWYWERLKEWDSAANQATNDGSYGGAPDEVEAAAFRLWLQEELGVGPFKPDAAEQFLGPMMDMYKGLFTKMGLGPDPTPKDLMRALEKMAEGPPVEGDRPLYEEVKDLHTLHPDPSHVLEGHGVNYVCGNCDLSVFSPGIYRPCPKRPCDVNGCTYLGKHYVHDGYAGGRPPRSR